MMKSYPTMLLLAFCWMASAVSVFASEPNKLSPELEAFFENEVRPLLADKCFECHGEKEQSGDLRLDSLAWIMAGGESGAAALVPGKSSESLLIEAINYESYEMPPAGKLDDEQIAILTRWVDLGAPWPGEHPDAPVRKKNVFDEEDRSWWAIQAVVDPPVPVIAPQYASWAKNEIDHFILDAMQSVGLKPAAQADPYSLVRRAYLDVTGLPPTPKQVDEFVNDKTVDAYEKLIDQLLNSKAYGEHAARQWLDLVRYADSDGYRADEYRPNAWRYRDYVIRSFNADKPYDRFIKEQIAGDELFPNDRDAQIALGYLRHWVYEWNIRDAKTQWTTILDDVTDTTADVFLGLGLQCAKCHNHKFDPLLQKDYFRLQAFFSPIMPHDVTTATDHELEQFEARQKLWETRTAEIRKKIDEIEKPYLDKYRDIAIDRFPDDLKAIARKPKESRTPYEEQMVYLIERQVHAEYDRLDSYLSSKDKESIISLRRELKAFDDLKPSPLPQTMAVSDVGAIAPPTVLPKIRDELISPGVPSILDPEPMGIEELPVTHSTGRRAALAKWLSSPENPLSTRVIANRTWQVHLGRGLAANASDFGRLGGPPSHPELLDWLTSRLIQDGWSLKSLHRRILLSATYRQSTEHPDFLAQQNVDPGNDYYWRRTASRLTAEQIRDSLLAVTAQLKDREGGPGVLPDSPYRTIYTRVMRNSPDELLNSFDLPQFFSSNSSRNTTTTPVQSLLMINSDLMLGHARRLAAALEQETSDRAIQVELAWNRVFGRQPTDAELNASIQFIDHQIQQIANEQQSKASGLVETSKLPYRDGQAVRFEVNNPSLVMSVQHQPVMDVSEFTIETFFQLRSIDKTGAVRTLVAKWNGDTRFPGWRLGITGEGSRRKPQTLVLQMVGEKSDGRLGEAAIFSDQHIAINTPYYASASFRLARDGKPGLVTFNLKDLSNDDEPLLTAEVNHDLVGNFNNDLPLTIGSFSNAKPQTFDGLIDDIRFVSRPLSTDEILQTLERDVHDTVGYWKFETDPGVMHNSAMDSLHIQGQGKAILHLTSQEAALADFCHALLNANEFLYIH